MNIDNHYLSLIKYKCSGCGTEKPTEIISLWAKPCPYCGAPLNRQITKLGFFIIFIFSIPIIIWIFGIITEPLMTHPIPNPNYILSTNQLYSEYSTNEVAADKKYKGKVVIVSGIIKEIGMVHKDIPWLYRVSLYVMTGSSKVYDEDIPYLYIGDGIICCHAKSDESLIAHLSQGQQVTIKGTVIGKVNVKDEFFVYLVNCYLQ